MTEVYINMAIDLFSIGRFTVHGYGLMIGLGFMLAVLIGCSRAKKMGFNEDHFFNMCVLVLIFGWIGGKILYVIVEFGDFVRNPLSVLGSGGFVVYGGILSGILTIYIYCRIRKIDFLNYIDLIVPSVAINQAMGRIGCFMAGCCYGRETDSFIGVVFPKGCLAPAGVKLLPTQLFSAAGDLIIFFITIWYASRKPLKGKVTALYLLLYSVGRFAIEFLRNDNRGNVGPLSTSQFISIFIALAAVIFGIFLNKKGLEPVNAEDLKKDDE